MSNESEHIVEWDNFTDKEKRVIIYTHFSRSGIEYNKETMLRIWNMANPSIIMGLENDRPYCRVSETSIDALKLLIETYC